MFFQVLVSSNDFKEMRMTLPNLMNSLRNIWMLSKHFNTDEQICGLLDKITNNTVRISRDQFLSRGKDCLHVEEYNIAVRSVYRSDQDNMEFKSAFSKSSQ